MNSSSSNPASPVERPPLSFGAVVLGALLSAAFLLLLGLLASGIGLVSFNLEHGQLPRPSFRWIGAVYGCLALIVSFFVGGFTASRFSRQGSRSSSVWHGLGSWSVVVVASAILLGSFASTLTTLLVQMGVGAGAAAGAVSSVDEVSRELSKVRIVTDMSIMKGKAVTQIVVPDHNQELAGIVAREAPREAKSAKRNLAPSPEAKANLREAAGTARSVLGEASFGLFGALLLGAIASALGGLAARRDPARALLRHS